MVTATQGFWSWMATAAKDLVGVIGFLLLAFAVIAFLIWLVVCAFSWAWTKSPRFKRWWQEHQEKPHEPFVIKKPTLTVGSFDDSGLGKDLGPSVAALIRSRFDPSSSPLFEVVTGHAAIGESLKALGEISSEAKAAMSIIAFFLNVLPDREYEVGGALQPGGRWGPGITLELTRDSKEFEAKTLWSTDYKAPAGTEKAFQFLAIPSAAWIEHRVAKRLGNTANLPADPKVWMLFNAGTVWQQKGDRKRARALYEQALDLDPYDSWSMSNLGFIESVEGNFATAEGMLERAVKRLKEKFPATANPDWFRASYNLAVVHSEWSASLRANGEVDESDEKRKLAHEESEALAKASLAGLLDEKATKALRILLDEWILPSSLGIYFGTGDPKVGFTFPAPAEEEIPDWDEKKVTFKALESNLTEQTALDYVAQRAERNPRIGYNLACALTHRGDDKRALRVLSDAMKVASEKKRTELAAHGKTDPSLGPLREDHGSKFRKALGGGL
jgi:tetratricopeptide (TPR) repeat protein